MATAVQNAGLVTVKINANQGDGIETLGYTRNGVDPEHDARLVNVPGDANGGDEGPPIEVQYMGEIARVRLELTNFDIAVARKIERRVPSKTLGTVPASGSTGSAGTFLLGTAANRFRLILDSPNDPQNYPIAIPIGAVVRNRGTKYQTFICEFECHKDASSPPVLFNTTVA